MIAQLYTLNHLGVKMQKYIFIGCTKYCSMQVWLCDHVQWYTWSLKWWQYCATIMSVWCHLPSFDIKYKIKECRVLHLLLYIEMWMSVMCRFDTNFKIHKQRNIKILCYYIQFHKMLSYWIFIVLILSHEIYLFHPLISLSTLEDPYLLLLLFLDICVATFYHCILQDLTSFLVTYSVGFNSVLKLIGILRHQACMLWDMIFSDMYVAHWQPTVCVWLCMTGVCIGSQSTTNSTFDIG